MAAPSPSKPDPAWTHAALYERVVDALRAIPAHFASGTVIEGILATDLQTLNAPLGATIEDQVVETLNRMRPVWDPGERYQTFSFHRQAQTFPDVLLKADRDGQEVILGIELKGWYLLAKEGEPNFRFQVAPAACAAADLLVVVPWALKNVLSGRPVTFKPFVIPARYAAEYRNYWWLEVREVQAGERHIESPPGVAPYPRKSDKIADLPSSDKGGNFGRLARTGILDDYLAEMRGTLLAGVPVAAWLSFFKKFKQ